MRAGDRVKHKPSGETWILAYVDADSGYLAWCGWPEGEAAVADCELVRACGDDDHRRMLEDWAARPNTGDRRQRVCSRQLFELVGGYIGAGI